MRLGRHRFNTPLQYIEVTFAEHGVERTVLFTPVLSAVTLGPEADRIAKEWLSALQEAIQANTGTHTFRGTLLCSTGQVLVGKDVFPVYGRLLDYRSYPGSGSFPA